MCYMGSTHLSSFSVHSCLHGRFSKIQDSDYNVSYNDLGSTWGPVHVDVSTNAESYRDKFANAQPVWRLVMVRRLAECAPTYYALLYLHTG